MSSTAKGHPGSDQSSDDDPHLGQVTPHHLISPALRRTRGMLNMRVGTTQNIDPPSDDSVVTASPSRDMVARRQLRRSNSAATPTKLRALTL